MLICAGLLHWAAPVFAQGPIAFTNIAALKNHYFTYRTNFTGSVTGVVIFQFKGKSFFIQDRSGGLFVARTNNQPFAQGTVVQVSGDVASGGFSPILNATSHRELGRTNVPAPLVLGAREVLSGKHDAVVVRVQGRLLDSLQFQESSSIRLLERNNAFHAEFDNPKLPTEWAEWEEGSLLEVTGVASIAADAAGQPRSFRILLRTPDDVKQLERAPWWTVDRTLKVITVLGAAVLVALVWVAALNFQVRKQTRDLEELNESLEKRVEERTAQLEAANKELEAFSYSVSHDLRAPLRAIDGFAQILMEDHFKQSDAEGKQLLAGVQKNSRKMAQLIDDLLAFSRVTRKPFELLPLDMEDVFRTVYEELKHLNPERRVEFNLRNVPKGLGDLAMIRQVAVNLLSNARKYSRNQEVAVIEVEGKDSGDEVIYSVKDNGVGFDMKYVDKLFGVFQRLHSDAQFEGTGVGLAIVQRIIQRHGGRIWAEAAPGQGATFYFTLKRPEAENA